MKRRHSFKYMPPAEGEFKSEVGLAVAAICAALVAVAILLIALGVTF